MLFPKAPDGGPCPLAKERLHIWPRGAHMLMSLANLDGSHTGTIYLPKKGPGSFEELSSDAKTAAFMTEHYGDAVPLMGGMAEVTRQFLGNPVGFLGTVRAKTWSSGRTLLIGDASHAIVPFFGQGTNCGFEDCLRLDEVLATAGSTPHHRDTVACFREYALARKPNGDAIAEMALDNFIEMRDRVGGERFLLMKAVENLLENRLPHKFRSRYAMVCYGGLGNVSYDVALKLGAIQTAILEELVPEHTTALEDVDMAKAEALVEAKITPLLKDWGIDLTTVSHDLEVPVSATPQHTARM